MSRMEWKNLLSPHRLCSELPGKITPERSPFQRDFDRIIFSGSFRRLQDKTQVFPLAQNDYVRTRLTHSMETSSIARSLGTAAGVFICDEFDTGGQKGHLSRLTLVRCCVKFNKSFAPRGRKASSMVCLYIQKGGMYGISGGIAHNVRENGRGNL